jgi:hypothetical protein
MSSQGRSTGRNSKLHLISRLPVSFSSCPISSAAQREGSEGSEGYLSLEL